MVVTFLSAAEVFGEGLPTGSSQFLGNSRRHGFNRVRNQRLTALRTPDRAAWKRQLKCQCFIEEVTRAWREWKEKRHGREFKKLPVVLFEGGRRLQYVHDGQRMWTVEADEDSAQSDLGATEGLGDWLGNVVERLSRALRRSLVPDQVRPHYVAYLKWKLMSRFFSSILHVQCTQAMLWAIGVGAKRTLPAAAALNWVIKDGLGRLGKLIYAASRGQTFDSNLKRVRFSTSVLFSMCVGLEMLTPVFPHHFLIFATLANVAKSISQAAYLATSSAIHRSFALTDNLADISAKGQAQTVVADNLGLAVAVCISNISHGHPRIEKILPLAMYPLLTLLELYAIYQQLQAVQLQTLNKERLEIVTETWVREGRVPSFEEVSKVEGAALLRPYAYRQVVELVLGGNRQLHLRIGAISLRSKTPEDVMNILNLQQSQRYVLCIEPFHPSPWLGRLGISRPGLLLWLHEKAAAEDIIMGVLQACLLQSMATTRMNLYAAGEELEKTETERNWPEFLALSRRKAKADIGSLLAAIKERGWHAKRILLSPQEECCYSLLGKRKS